MTRRYGENRRKYGKNRRKYGENLGVESAEIFDVFSKVFVLFNNFSDWETLLSSGKKRFFPNYLDLWPEFFDLSQS